MGGLNTIAAIEAKSSTRLSGRLRALDLESIAQGALTTPPRDRETNLEVS